MLQSIYKQRLLAERDRLDNSINQKIAASTESLSEMTDELSMYDQHSADLGSETFEREKDAGLQEMLENELVKVNDALRRLEEGNYGVCQLCGQPIDHRRLDRMPATSLCIGCAQKTQKSFQRPQEEEILNLYEIEEKGGQFEVAGYDLFDEYGLSESGKND